jgi:hypothetical protein
VFWHVQEVDRLMRKCERIAHKMRVRCRSVRTDKDDVMDGSGEDEEDANEPKETLVGQPESIQGTLKSYQVYGHSIPIQLWAGEARGCFLFIKIVNEVTAGQRALEGSQTGLCSRVQLVGLNWLALLYKNEYGGILADEMVCGDITHCRSCPCLAISTRRLPDSYLRYPMKHLSALCLADSYGSCLMGRCNSRPTRTGPVGAEW